MVLHLFFKGAHVMVLFILTSIVTFLIDNIKFISVKLGPHHINKILYNKIINRHLNYKHIKIDK